MSKNVGRSSGGKATGTGGSVRRTTSKSGKSYNGNFSKNTRSDQRGGGASGGGGTNGFKE